MTNDQEYNSAKSNRSLPLGRAGRGSPSSPLGEVRRGLLLFGGTTEGRIAIRTLEEAGSPYFYSTKTGEQDVVVHHGTHICGVLDADAMRRFCIDHDIHLMVDAAHPFATQLHQTVAAVASQLAIPAIRFERIFPHVDVPITWVDDYAQLSSILPSGTSLFATTGVQTIARLKPLEKQGISITYRILPRQSSINLAHVQGATDYQLCFFNDTDDDADILRRLHPDAILLKESGTTGHFLSKVKAAYTLGVRIIALRCPPTPPQFHVVNGPHGLRLMVERLLPDFFPLHSGLTTGTCATAAAVAHALHVCRGERPDSVPVVLPDGETIYVDVHYGDTYAYVLKLSGDDPDITNGIEIRASVVPAVSGITICGGCGVGRITLPGLDYPPGEAAINRVPRQMIHDNVSRITSHCTVTISVPEGEYIAHRTFNPRLGIEGGISIIGVSGIVMPYSEQAFVDSIRKCMEVAHSSGADRVVIGSGAKSEQTLRNMYPDLPPQAFVQYGNYIGHTLRIASELGIRRVVMGIMIGKALKLAAGHLDTHSRSSALDKEVVARLMLEAGCDDATFGSLSTLTMANQLWTLLPQSLHERFKQVVVNHCMSHCAPLLPQGELEILIISPQ